MKTRKLQNSKFIRQETTQPYTHRIANTKHLRLTRKNKPMCKSSTANWIKHSVCSLSAAVELIYQSVLWKRRPVPPVQERGCLSGILCQYGVVRRRGLQLQRQFLLAAHECEQPKLWQHFRSSEHVSVPDWPNLPTNNHSLVTCLFSHRPGTLSDAASDVCPSIAYIGPKSRTKRPRKTKIRTEAAHVARDSDTTFKVKRKMVNLQWHLWWSPRQLYSVYCPSGCRKNRHLSRKRYTRKACGYYGTPMGSRVINIIYVDLEWPWKAGREGSKFSGGFL